MYPTFGGLTFGAYGFANYGSVSLTETSPPQSFVEPLDVAEVGAYLRFSEADLADPGMESELTGFIIAAREQAEIFQGRDLVRKQSDLSRDFWPYWPNPQIKLRPPLISVDLVQYRDSTGAVTTLTENTDYIVDTAKQPGIIIPPYNSTWPAFTPWPTSAILVRYSSGVAADSAFWSDAGARVKVGMKYLISAWFTNRLPFVTGITAANEYPMSITSCLSQGAVARVP